MMAQDLATILWWWFSLFVLGVSLLPLLVLFFKNFIDKGYFFAKILSIIFLSYISFVLGVLHLIPFSRNALFVIVAIFFLISFLTQRKNLPTFFTRRFLRFVVVEEIVFLIVLCLWTFIRGFNSEIHGLEKFMDFGFMNSILRSEFFPPRDMWLTPYSINYYYFGHLYSAVLTKFSGIPSYLTYNLILGTIAGFCFGASFSLGMNFISPVIVKMRKLKLLFAGILSGLLVTFAGNLHTIYTLFKPYENEHPVPPWSLSFSPGTFPNNYWYPNATRFIYNTIHEFPIYSWVVADLHGHVLDIPFVLLTIALLYSFYQFSTQEKLTKNQIQLKILRYVKISNFGFIYLLLLGFLLSVMYMTNAWDGLIYLLLTGIVIVFITFLERSSNAKKSITRYVSSILERDNFLSVISRLAVVFTGFVIFSLPFSLHFKPFVSGIGVLCSPDFLTNIGRIGPFLFEKDHCQHSPFWQLVILYGFFLFFAISLIVFLRRRKKTISDFFIFLLIILSAMLIIIPEFLYAKDIYPAHYRANTMFKLVFQAFIMLQLVSAYSIYRVASGLKYLKVKITFLLVTVTLLVAVLIYPYYSVMSYYNVLRNYQGINGITYLKNLYPTDFAAIEWINKNIKGQPVILEAQGDSYTDYARVSTNTGLPTVLGWTVHEWLWRGEYDYPPDDPKKLSDATPYFPAPRIGDVQLMYESEDMKQTKNLLRKYKVEYIFIGDLERQKYPNLNEQKWEQLGNVIYENNQTKIIKLSS